LVVGVAVVVTILLSQGRLYVICCSGSTRYVYEQQQRASLALVRFGQKEITPTGRLKTIENFGNRRPVGI